MRLRRDKTNSTKPEAAFLQHALAECFFYFACTTEQFLFPSCLLAPSQLTKTTAFRTFLTVEGNTRQKTTAFLKVCIFNSSALAFRFVSVVGFAFSPKTHSRRFVDNCECRKRVRRVCFTSMSGAERLSASISQKFVYAHLRT